MRRVILGLDQGKSTGWGIAGEGLGPVLRHGLARTADDRVAVVKLALEYAGGDPKWLFAMFEKHDHIRADRLTNADTQTARRGRYGAPERPVDGGMLIGMGKNYGKWQQVLEERGVPLTHQLEVKPATWRAALHGQTRGDDSVLKGAALKWVNNLLPREHHVTDHNEAEGYCITAYGALHGLARYDAEKQGARMVARVKRETAKQTDLFGGSK